MKILAILGAVLVLAACGSPAPVSGTPETASKQPVAELNGLYTIEWSGEVTHTGVPVDLGIKPGERNAWAFRTLCRDDGCVATGGGIASTSDMTAPLAALRVADYVDGHWTIVWRTEKGLSCTGADGKTYSSPMWSSFDITDDLSLTVTVVSTGDCPFIEVRRPVMTKVDDDLHGVPVPDPAEQPARVVPAGAGFTGDYRVTRTPRGGAEQSTTRQVTTYCRRDQPRCVSTSVNDEAKEFSVLEFDQDAFSRHAAAVEQPCGNGVDGVAAVTETLKAAQSTPPLRTLTGERTTTFGSGCAGTVTEDVTYALADD